MRIRLAFVDSRRKRASQYILEEEEKGREMSKVKKSGTRSPAVAIAFSALGWIVLTGGAFVWFVSMSARDGTVAAIGVSIALSSIFLFGFGAVITRLHQIEFHMRPENRKESEPAVSQ